MFTTLGASTCLGLQNFWKAFRLLLSLFALGLVAAADKPISAATCIVAAAGPRTIRLKLTDNSAHHASQNKKYRLSCVVMIQYLT